MKRSCGSPYGYAHPARDTCARLHDNLITLIVPRSLLIHVLKRLALSVATVEQVERTVVMRVSGNVNTSPVFIDFNCGIIGCFISLFIVLFIFLLTLRYKDTHFAKTTKQFDNFFFKKCVIFFTNCLK